jgi:molecular chaperone GrpE
MVDKSEKVDTQKDKLIEEDFKQGEGAIQEDHLPPEQAGETEATGEEEKPQEPTAEEKLAELQDRYLRLSAEFDNFRKRTLKEKIELQRGANENLLFTLLPVADDFDRALQSIEEAKEMDAVREGKADLR